VAGVAAVAIAVVVAIAMVAVLIVVVADVVVVVPATPIVVPATPIVVVVGGAASGLLTVVGREWKAGVVHGRGQRPGTTRIATARPGRSRTVRIAGSWTTGRGRTRGRGRGAAAERGRRGSGSAGRAGASVHHGCPALAPGPASATERGVVESGGGDPPGEGSTGELAPFSIARRG
jgi:hypothetical protein